MRRRVSELQRPPQRHRKIAHTLAPSALSTSVLSIGKLGQGQANYYLETVAQGIEDYYTGAGEAPGRWVGAAACELGAHGEVEDDDLHAVLGGAHPGTANPLATPHSGSRVPGFDLTFSAPKSVSVTFGVADADASAAVRDAHDAAVDAALDYLERHVVSSKRVCSTK